ncbi:HsdR family type I site-specific deoxyribonuclease [Pontiellaceae bacterium B1224]|nr:HsdR family type I site-specific deoxyribonuclease [Pontiellaceae bacterium B1224]
MKFTEAQLEEAIIELLEAEGYPHVLGETIDRQSNEVLIKADLRAFLAKQYAKDGITPGEIEAVILKLDAYSAADLYESNKAIMKLVSDGFLLKREDHTQKDLFIQLIDYSELPAFQMPKPGSVISIVAEKAPAYITGGNIFKMVNQLEITGSHLRIPDGILYINGLPLVVFEFKSAIREEATIHDAFTQLTVRYKRDIPELFKYNAFTVISDGVNSKVGSFFAPYEFFYAWRRVERIPHPQPLSQGEKGVNYKGGFSYSGLAKRARELRQKQTPAEEVMWELVRNRQLADLKFRRQHQIGPYIVDFFCNEKKLVVELDGSAHEIEAQQKKDHKRTAYLESLGFSVLRFDNNDFLNDPQSILEQIANPHLNPLPAGEDLQTQLPSTSGRGAGGEGVSDAQGINSLYSMVQGLFHQATLLDVIRNYIYVPDVSRREEKILCRYPQYYAATKLFHNIFAHLKPQGDGKGGTYFGATGCGKSFTMLFLVRLLMRSVALSSPTIVLITDRTDLDDQLSTIFTNAKGYIGDESVISVESRGQLRDLLKGRNSGGVFLTTIHKFTEDTELLTERANVICISDEAHRSQVNLDQKVVVDQETGVVRKTFGFAKYLHDSLPNATYVGFTGTPIDATLDVFGPVVDSYTMTESVADEITVRIVYEGRAAKVLLNNSKLEEIEKYYADCAEAGSSEYAIEESKKASAKMGSILGDPQRIETLAADFVAHYEKRVSEGSTVTGKAMFVSSSRPVAYAFYKAVIALRPEWAEVKVCADGVELSEAEAKTIKPMERIKMVMTRGQDDEKELFDLLGSKEYRKELDRQFKTAKSNFKIAIVVDMWLTGFDVPFLDTIYIDKPVQRHNLIQTISRVNRKFEGKGKGLVVDYIGIKKQMNLALAHYSKADQANIEEVEASIIVVKDHLDLLSRLFHLFDAKPYFNGSPTAQLQCLNLAAEFVQITEKVEKRFMGLVKRLKAAYDICSGSDDFTDAERDHIHFYLAVRSIVAKLTKGEAPDTAQMNAKVRNMIAEALQSDGVEEIFKLGEDGATEIDIFGGDYLAKIEKIKLPNTKIKLLQQLLKKAIEEFKKINKVKGVDFSEQFLALVKKYNEREEKDVLRSEVLEGFSDEMIELIHALHREKESFGEMGIDLEEKSFYDILLSLAHKYDFTYPEDKLIALAKEVKKVVDDKAKYTDWSRRDDIKAELKVSLIILLAEHGYPPVDRDEVYKEIFEQAENFKKYKG